MSEELKPCPFCGSTKLKIDKKSVLDRYTGLGVRLERHTYSVRCNVCHARGRSIGGIVVDEKDALANCYKHTTDKELAKRAIAGWNRRAKLEREVGYSILKDGKGNPVYLDELEPDRGNMNTEIFPDCGIMCYLAQK